jgi:hypothetical protein
MSSLSYGADFGLVAPLRSAAQYGETAAPNNIQFNGGGGLRPYISSHAYRRSTVTWIAWKACETG